MSDLTTASWFPVMTLLIGYGTKSFSDWLQDKRNIAREREAREAARQDQRYERRTNFQRQTLLDLQEASMQLARATGAAHHQDEMAYRTTGKWQKQLLPSDLDEGYRLAQTLTSMLSVRVRDDSVRQLVKNLKTHSTEAMISANQDDSGRAMTNMASVHEELHERIGELLREIDSAYATDFHGDYMEIKCCTRDLPEDAVKSPAI
jgi:hypothetical protein